MNSRLTLAALFFMLFLGMPTKKFAMQTTEDVTNSCNKENIPQKAQKVLCTTPGNFPMYAHNGRASELITRKEKIRVKRSIPSLIQNSMPPYSPKPLLFKEKPLVTPHYIDRKAYAELSKCDPDTKITIIESSHDGRTIAVGTTQGAFITDPFCYTKNWLSLPVRSLTRKPSQYDKDFNPDYNTIASICWSPDGRYLALGNERARWDEPAIFVADFKNNLMIHEVCFEEPYNSNSIIAKTAVLLRISNTGAISAQMRLRLYEGVIGCLCSAQDYTQKLTRTKQLYQKNFPASYTQKIAPQESTEKEPVKESKNPFQTNITTDL